VILVQHPIISGWLIVTPEVETLLAADWVVVNTDSSTMHPLASHEPDFLDTDIEPVRSWALTAINIWRGDQRRALGLSDAWGQALVYSGKFDQAQRWIDDETRPFYFEAEARARGLSNQQMASLIIAHGEAWLLASDRIEAAYITTKVAIDVAEHVKTIADILIELHKK
jgi:hypothetical protein